jgi:transcriptional regulator with XRE-family HTH domain
MLKAKLAQEMKNKHLSTHQAAREIGTSHTTILRALRGEVVDLATILKFGDWMGVKPSTLINSLAGTKSALSDQIVVMLGKHPRLENEFAQAVKKILNGEVDASVVEDIATYAAYKINLSASRQ